MAIQFDVATRNAMLDVIETQLGPSPILKLFTGVQGASTQAADQGTTVAVMDLPADAFEPAADGQKTLKGLWRDLEANANGILGHFRLYTSALVCKWQGSVGMTNADMIVQNSNIVAGQTITVTSLTMTAPHA